MIPQITKDIIASQPIVIPIFHVVALKLQHMVNEKTYNIDDVIKLVNEDTALASEMIKYANSPYYAGTSPITTIKNAIVRLGSKQIVNLAFSASLANIRSDNPFINSHMKDLWYHSLSVAKASACLAVEINKVNKLNELDSDEAYLAGLLHDIGKLYLLKAIDGLSKSGVIQPNNNTILHILDDLNYHQGVRVLKHFRLPDIFSDILERLGYTNWKTGSLDHLIAVISLSDIITTCICDDIKLLDSNEILNNIDDKIDFINIGNLSEIYNIINSSYLSQSR